MCYTILLVDDDSILVSSISTYLSSYGFNIKSANHGYEALEKLIFKPDLIILDIVMPEINGYDLIALIQENNLYKDIPFIFLTAKGMTKDRIMGYDLGCHGYLVKPFDPEELVAMIKNILNKHIKALSSQMVKKNHWIPKAKQGNIHNFTVTEKKVLKLVMQGLTNKEISDLLCFTTRNVEKYVSRLLAKTSTKNRTQLAQYGSRLDIDS